jgi:uncharacterized membrane protein YphA (DoxX/SURF4 family)
MAYVGPGEVVEHRMSPAGRWLRERRIRLAVAIALAEGILVLFGVVPKLAAILIALVVIGLYFVVGRSFRQSVARESALIAMGSQALMILVPLFLIVVGWLAIIAVVVIGVVAVFVLLSRR